MKKKKFNHLPFQFLAIFCLGFSQQLLANSPSEEDSAIDSLIYIENESSRELAIQAFERFQEDKKDADDMEEHDHE